MGQMVTYLPISLSFIRVAGHYVDETFGFAAGWNFFVLEAILVPFEITACKVIIHYWSNALSTGAVVAIVIVRRNFVQQPYKHLAQRSSTDVRWLNMRHSLL